MPATVDVNFKNAEDRALFDSTHDFKTLISDVLHFTRKSGDISLHRIIFTFLLKECFPSIQIKEPSRKLQEIAKACGRYTSPTLRAGSCCRDVENDFFNNNIYTPEGFLADNIYHFKEESNGQWFRTDSNGNRE